MQLVVGVWRLVVKGTRRIRFGGDLLSTVWTGPVLMWGLLELLSTSPGVMNHSLAPVRILFARQRNFASTSTTGCTTLKRKRVKLSIAYLTKLSFAEENDARLSRVLQDTRKERRRKGQQSLFARCWKFAINQSVPALNSVSYRLESRLLVSPRLCTPLDGDPRIYEGKYDRAM